MTSAPCGQGLERGLLRALIACALLAGCAEGAKIGDSFREGDDGSGGSRGDGGRRNDGGARGDGDGDGGSHGPGTSVVSGSGVGSSASSSADASSASSAAATTAAATTAAATTAAATTSASSGGGPVDCDAPLSPAGDCGNGQHCNPTNQGGQPVCSDAGNGGQYNGCDGASMCAPIFGCVPIVSGERACCLQFCTNSGQCPGAFDYCFPLVPPQYAGGVEYGVCWDEVPEGCGPI